MNATQATVGKLYRVIACPAYEYLTIGRVYRCTSVSHDSTGLHNPKTGAGTYVMGYVRKLVALIPAD